MNENGKGDGNYSPKKNNGGKGGQQPRYQRNAGSHNDKNFDRGGRGFGRAYPNNEHSAQGYGRKDDNQQGKSKNNKQQQPFNSYFERNKKNDRFRFDKNKGPLPERSRWTPPKIPKEEIPVPVCPICGQPITELALAFSDKNSENAIHFECARDAVFRGTELAPGDTIAYIGAGRFGIVHYPNQQNYKNMTIKTIVEWEKREERVHWRRIVANHFSIA
jgi:hypothetical protein